MASYSILIKGGEVLRGRKFERLDVGIKDDKIQEVGDLSGAKAELLIDASGKYVAPGFIDLTSHSDTHWTLFAFPGQESLLAQGITTILGGNCGASLAPLVKAEDIGGISKWADVREININWQSTAEFLRELEKHSLGVNFAALVGHGTLRRGVLGHESRKASREEISKLTFLLEKSLEEGAFGLSTSLAAAHARNTTAEELLSLFREVGRAGGLTKHHLRDEGKNILPAIVELISLGRQSQAKIHFSHFKLLGRQAWELFPETLALIESAREEELHLTLDVFPYARTGSLLYLLLPPWVVEGGLDKILQSLREPSRRQAILEYLKSLTLHYDQMTIASSLRDKNILGKTIEAAAQNSGLEPEELILKLLEVNELKVSIFNEVISLPHLEKLIAKEYAGLASDGVGYNLKEKPAFDLPHPRSFGAFPRALEIFCRQKEILPWPELLYKMSTFPAELLGLKDRGRVEKGAYADLVVLDPSAIESPPDYSGVMPKTKGIEWVLVNGGVAVKEGFLSPELSGRVLRRK